MSGFIDNENENRVGTAGNLEQLRLNCKKERIGIVRERENRRKQRSHNETKFFNQKRKQLEKSNCPQDASQRVEPR